MKRLGVAVAVLLVVWSVGYMMAHKGLNKPDDVLIRELMVRGEHSIDTKNAREAVSCISPSYHGQTGGGYQGIKLTIAQAFAADMSYDAQVELPEIHVNGDDATAATKVTLYNISGLERDTIFCKNVTLILKKEPIKRYWIYPIKEWKINGIEGLGISPGGDIQ